VLARNIKGLARLCALEHLLGGIELSWLGGVRDVTGVQQQIGLAGQRVDLVDGQLECAGHILIGRLAEADVAVTDLDKAEA